MSESAMREAIGQASLDKALAFDPSITDHARVTAAAHARQLRHGHPHHQRQAAGGRACPRRCRMRSATRSRPTRTASATSRRRRRTATTCVPRARGDAAKELLDAEAYRLQVLALAQGETSRFDQVLAQYEHAPAVTRERMYLETMENVYKNSRKVIVDTKSGGNMLYLPIDKLISTGAAVGRDAERHA